MKRIITTVVVITTLILACKKEKKSVPALTTTSTTNVTATSITSGGNVTDDGGSAITKRGIVWADHAGPTVGDSITTDGAGSGSFTSTISKLQANSTYYIRAYAINASGTAYGNELSVKTSAGVPSITTNAISELQPLSALSGGNITNDGGASVTERGVVYSTTANPTISNLKVTAGTGTGNFTAKLSPLASQTSYFVRAYATNSFGTAYGNQVQFSAASANTVTDVDGNVYPYLSVCGKDWFGTNLKVTKYKNGESLLDGSDASFNWNTATQGAYGYPNNDISKKDSFGLYYTSLVIADARGICPAGWHVPTDDEWKAVEICAGMSQVDADAAGCRGTVGTKFLEGGSTGLNIQKAGYLYVPTTPQYTGFRQEGDFWTSTPRFTGFRNRGFNAATCGDPATVYRGNGTNIYSIRCVRD
jgi:uncharacterized protein (TIGR02145 family)